MSSGSTTPCGCAGCRSATGPPLAVSDLDLDVAPRGGASRCSDPTAPARPPRSRCARASSAPTPAPSRCSDWTRCRQRPAARTDRGHAAGRRRLPGGPRRRDARTSSPSYAARPLDPAWLLDTLGLTDAASTTYRRLSGGQQQRLALACAIVGRPGVGVPRRADRRNGRPRPAGGVGTHRRAAPRRGDGGADHPSAQGGRGTGRPDRHHRPRIGGRRRDAGGVDAQRRRGPAAVHRAAAAGSVAADVGTAGGIPGQRADSRASTWSRARSTRRCSRR